MTLRRLLEALGFEPAEPIVDVEIGKQWAWAGSPVAISAKLDAYHGTEVTIRMGGQTW